MNNQINEENKIERKDNSFRNISLAIVGVFVLIAAVAGGTFAYFAFSASNNTTITGTAATASLNLTVSKVTTSATGPLVPQKEATIMKALQAGCVDGNNNTVCQVYSIKIDNTSTAAATVKASIAFAFSGAYANLKWKTLSAAPTSSTSPTLGTMTSATTTSAVIESGINLAATSGTKTLYIVVWIDETSSAQNSTDYGTFTGTVTVEDSAGNGLTSTFTS